MNKEQLTFFRSVFNNGTIPNLKELVSQFREQNSDNWAFDDFERELYSHDTFRMCDESVKATVYEIPSNFKDVCERIDPNECLRILVRTMIRWRIRGDPVMLAILFNMSYLIDYESNYGLARNYDQTMEKFKYMAIYDAAYRVSIGGERIRSAFGLRKQLPRNDDMKR